MIKKLVILLAALLTLSGCQAQEPITLRPPDDIYDTNNPNYRELMRQWVMEISVTAKENNPSFLIIPQNCSSLFTDTGYADGQIYTDFLGCIDGVGQEGISYGNNRYNVDRDAQSKEQITNLLNVGMGNGISIVSINYCDITKKIDDAIKHDIDNGYISFVSSSFDLNEIPTDKPINENSNDIVTLGDAQNWLFMLDPQKYNSKEEYINALCETNFDAIVSDAFFYDDIMLNEKDLARLKYKANGGKRLAISYLSIGEAEDYRYYWQQEYNDNPPEWILQENPNWAGNYPVEYWDEDWQNIIAKGDESYLRRIIDAGFDGVYLDIVDGYETFEDMAGE